MTEAVALKKGGRPRKVVGVAEVQEPKMAPYGHADRAIESATLARLKAEPLESVFVPRKVALSGVLEVVVNGLRLSYPGGRAHDMPASVAALVKRRLANINPRDLA